MDILKYRYDAENLKIALKCRYLRISPYGFMNDKGNYSAREVVGFVRRGDFSRLSENLSAAAKLSYERIKDADSARECDVIIESAALLDAMAEHLRPKEDIPSYYVAK